MRSATRLRNRSTAFRQVQSRLTPCIRLPSLSAALSSLAAPTAASASASAAPTGVAVSHAFDASCLQFLACPLSKGPLHFEPPSTLFSLVQPQQQQHDDGAQQAAHRIDYPIEDGLPLLAVDRATLSSTPATAQSHDRK